MMATLLVILGAERYTQHSICLTNDPVMMFLYILGDGVTFLSYFAIGVSLLVSRYALDMGRTRPSIRILFGAFIFLCGLSHLTMIVTLFWGVYRLDIMVRVAMAAVSAVTAIVTVKDLIAARR